MRLGLLFVQPCQHRLFVAAADGEPFFADLHFFACEGGNLIGRDEERAVDAQEIVGCELVGEVADALLGDERARCRVDLHVVAHAFDVADVGEWHFHHLAVYADVEGGIVGRRGGW